MPTAKYVVRYHAEAMAAIHDRRRLQRPPLSRWQSSFPERNAVLYVADRVKTKGPRLHAGIEITAVLERDYVDNIVEIASPLV